MSSQETQSRGEAVACENFDQIAKEHPNLLVVFSQEGCSLCNPYVDTIAQVEKQMEQITIAEVQLGKGEELCEDLADRLKVSATPTAVFFRDGKVEKTLYPSGDQQKDLEALLELASEVSRSPHIPSEGAQSSPQEAASPPQ